jgi:hypothetical protein
MFGMTRASSSHLDATPTSPTSPTSPPSSPPEGGTTTVPKIESKMIKRRSPSFNSFSELTRGGRGDGSGGSGGGGDACTHLNTHTPPRKSARDGQNNGARNVPNPSTPQMMSSKSKSASKAWQNGGGGGGRGGGGGGGKGVPSGDHGASGSKGGGARLSDPRIMEPSTACSTASSLTAVTVTSAASAIQEAATGKLGYVEESLIGCSGGDGETGIG